jgi:hypothetical protein
MPSYLALIAVFHLLACGESKASSMVLGISIVELEGDKEGESSVRRTVA